MPPENPLHNSPPGQPQQTPPPVIPPAPQPQYQQPPLADVPQPLPAQAFLPNYDDPQAKPAPAPAQHFDTSQQVRPTIAPDSYDFIVNPQKPKRTAVPLPGGIKQRIILVAVIVVVLLIAIPTVASLLKPKDKTLPALLAVADQQQELIHLADPTSTNNSQSLSSDTANTISTINQAIASSQKQLTTYLANNGIKLKPGQIIATNETSLDATLTTAASGGTYQATLLSTLQTQLDSYGNSLKAAYALEKGPKGRALLTNDYKQQQLLLTALNSSGNSSEQ